jgi:hypothetical protein
MSEPLTSGQFYMAYYLRFFEHHRFIHQNCAEWYIVGNLWRSYYLSAGDATDKGQWFSLTDKGRKFVQDYYKMAITPEQREHL